MRIPILVEPIENGRFRARAGEPLAMCVEGATSKEATGLLTAKLKERFAAGAALWFVELPNGSISNSLDPLEYTPTPVDDWFFGELQKEIAENRRLEAEEEARRWPSEESGV